MISLLALIFCFCMFVYTLTNNPSPLIVVIQVLCVLINVPGTVDYLSSR